ncbi:MAG: RlmE family RNA methyltransferase [Deltaproteobacteria bacterium]|jgi:23S rRNA (uridine2552-2'-O)-methyltransferase|nr:RlmE family RNA methyltransferase [Deltaproteobacteria bacterium]
MTIKDRKRIDDYYSQKARKEKYPARSVWKLEEFDSKYSLFKAGQKILDLGCSPGSWSLYAAKIVGPRGLVLGLDLDPPDSSQFPENVILKKANLLEDSLELAQGFSPFQVILSDMAPKTSGRREIDQSKSLELCQMAWVWTKSLSAIGGDFLFKIFQSPDADAFLKEISVNYERQIRLKPKATRSQSQEIFVLNKSYKGEPKGQN